MSIVLLTIVFLFPSGTFAQQAQLEAVGQQVGFFEQSLPVVIGKIIRIVLSVVGVVLLVIVIYAGFLWMTAGGSPEQIEKAKKWLTNGVIGLVIILFSYSIVTYIINQLLDEGGVFGSPSTYYEGYGQGGGGWGGGALSETIEDHYPGRDATNVPRNTFIMVKFYEPLNPDSVRRQDTSMDCGDQGYICGTLNFDNIKIYRTEDSEEGSFPTDSATLVRGGKAALSPDKRIFFFQPDPVLGSDTVDVNYSVFLTNDIQKEDGSKIFSNNKDYGWNFTTSTVIDLTPPRVVSVLPSSNNPEFEFFANSLIQINFNEPVLPPAVLNTAGSVEDKSNSIYIEYEKDGAVGYVEGTFNVGLNRFKTMEFLPAADCENSGPNSCGEIPKCLPKGATIKPYIRAASVNAEGLSFFPFDGLVDAAGNSLDGNADGVAQGPAEDDYSWQFKTGSILDLLPPTVNSVSPQNAAEDLPVDVELKATFSENLSASSVNSRTALLTGDDWARWFVVHFADTPAGEDGQTITDSSTVQISHADFDKALEVEEGQEAISLKYYPVLTSGIKDLQQNCYQPCKDTGSCAGALPGQSCCPDPDFNNQRLVPGSTCPQ